ncbi:MAG: 2-dehydropantoate 2-reductase [Veillonellaceae bacterium]|nr:2-dehydropantoate 2-reductase [Veillonellaceae bacterium]
MKIVIIGAGAMGGLFAARLAAAGEDVSVVDVWAEHIETIRTQGLILKTEQGEVRANPAAVTRVEDLATSAADLVIVFVKSGMTAAAARSAQTILGLAGRVLTLQNGLGNAETIATVVGADRVLAGTTAQGATLLGPGRIRHGGRGDTHIGRLTGPADDFCREAATILSRAGIPAIAEDAVQSLIWGKLVINVGINALTALLRFTNGQLNDHAETRELVKLAVTEAARVAAASGIRLPYDDAVEKVLAVAAATATNRSSMLQDILHGRATEIDAINGALVREGNRLGMPTPVNATLTLLIKALEKQQGICG